MAQSTHHDKDGSSQQGEAGAAKRATSPADAKKGGSRPEPAGATRGGSARKPAGTAGQTGAAQEPRTPKTGPAQRRGRSQQMCEVWPD